MFDWLTPECGALSTEVVYYVGLLVVLYVLLDMVARVGYYLVFGTMYAVFNVLSLEKSKVISKPWILLLLPVTPLIFAYREWRKPFDTNWVKSKKWIYYPLFRIKRHNLNSG